MELFGPTIQGEGTLCGQRSHFIRLGGCTYRCTWCDSLHAVTPELVKKNATMMTAQEIVTGITKLDPSPWITLSGGDPVMWDLESLVKQLTSNNYKVAVETQGAIYRKWLYDCQHVTVSPKPPSSGMAENISWDVLNRYQHLNYLGKSVSFKVVIFDEEDFQFATYIKSELSEAIPFFLSVGTPQDIHNIDTTAVRHFILERMTWLFERTLKEPTLVNATVLPQLHALAWGTEKGK